MNNPERRAAVFLGLCVCLALGCSAPKKSNFLSTYDQMTRGAHVDRYWVDGAHARHHDITVVGVQEIRTVGLEDEEGVTVGQCAEWLKAALIESTRGGKTSFVFDGAAAERADAVLEVAVTEMTPGSASARIWVGELGAGHAWVQVEARLRHPGSPEDIARFVSRKRSSGDIGLRDVGGDAGPTLVHELLVKIGADLIEELRASFSL